MTDKKKKTTDVNEMIEKLVKNGQKALEEFMEMGQEQIDKIVHAMALAGINDHMRLAKLAVEETGRGVFEDKVIKNIFSTEYIWHSIKDEKTVGVITENDLEGYVEVAEPVGVIAGITPVTNPTSTTMFKSLISVKTRNPIIFAFHPSAQKCSAEAAKTLRDAAVAKGAPKHCIQWIEVPSIEATNALMKHPGVSLILATGGSGMVHSAYSCGKPALGVGPGNVPCYINKDVDVERACTDLILSKTFDNGMICASEQAVIVDEDIRTEFESIMKKYSCYFLNEEETEKVTNYVINKAKMAVNPEVVGKSAAVIAKNAGIEVPEDTKILIAKLPKPSIEYPLSIEKLSPVLAYFVVKDAKQGFEYAREMLKLGGLGHSAVIHSNNEQLCKEFGEIMKVGRVIVNSPSSQGAIGDIYNTNTPSLTLGCGSYGRNSTTSNVSTVNLINKKRIAKRRVNMQWFKIPPKIYFEHGSVQYLQHMPDISRAFIVTDPVMVKLGYVSKVLYYLRKRKIYCHSEIFADVEPDPSIETIMRGVDLMKKFEPDVIIALGGGSAIDAAKCMWLFYENPDTSFDGLKLKFLDIRKRAFQYPNLGEKTKLVAIPTTSGTGSEVTSFSVVTDKEKGNIKYPLADYELTPDVAIIDPQFVMTMPKNITADTGMDVLTHAIEAYVSILASDYTNALAMKAIELVFKYLPRSYNDPSDRVAREKMHNASCIAGMAFTNAFLGINHSLAHKLGGEFNIPHGRANAVLLPHVIRYNAQKPTKFAIFPKYEKYVADYRYAQISRFLNFGGETQEEQIENLIKAIKELMRKLNMPMTIAECGVNEAEFLSKLQDLAERAFEDQCTTTNPRYPLVEELVEIYKKAYYGE
ncbi:MAG TPA: bifunctional acetaldehyde-CoA/alcohol dehydrogenase [Ruminiclostridium sp.]|jgi:acetaldehyde dehydrogenase/alcohol dehydrogenase|uniref:Aldehyde-alcohol dehydrogenase n=1 Tax=Acetivibrio saccincola TaxID=1677857 RepID=A0A2K9EAF5_9FIRM|nr:bifunctional acetaldehyde-CoA/alcohol dehydrogenase [Acetivibrio saccincola]AUG58686.1 Aldehyde-alcohol dehydrogenase [Acetivibrio saccincola]NLW26390.1 bifunctional acetaldehyde-CoA/alcohol dehydrogenase [Acetivibrio saccincola]PQQ66206.1 bifunctional acetaldehyde-CoA/alcohol dehydrogenase [Acetivibrio saccincola]HAA42526.1 bifunctional acetaldehyde-CoA/alcohol dehydrogenase [Ruminiclostridium sp.]